MQHNFMPGDIVTYRGNIGEVIARGASPGNYFVQVLFKDGTRRDFNNSEIKKLKKS